MLHELHKKLEKDTADLTNWHMRTKNSGLRMTRHGHYAGHDSVRCNSELTARTKQLAKTRKKIREFHGQTLVKEEQGTPPLLFLFFFYL